MTHRGGLNLSIIIWRIGGGAKFPFALGSKNYLGDPDYIYIYIYIYNIVSGCVTMVWVQIPSREEQKFDSSKKSNSNTVWFNFQTYIYIYIYILSMLLYYKIN